MKTGMTGSLKKQSDKYNSVLKACIAQESAGFNGLIKIFTLILVILLLLQILVWALFGYKLWIMGIAWGLIFYGTVAVRNIFYRRRLKKYLTFYQKRTGYSAEELQMADQEFMGPGAVCIAGKTVGAKEEGMCIVTDHYFLSVRMMTGCLKLEDVVAVFYSCQIPGLTEYAEGLHIISKQDVEKPGKVSTVPGKEIGGFSNTLMKDQTLCMEVTEEIAKRAPHVITSQNIVVNGIPYDLLKLDNWQADWKKILKEPT